MDLSSLSESDLMALQAGDMQSVSEEGLKIVIQNSQNQGAQNFLQKRAPNISWQDRMLLKNLAQSPRAMVDYLDQRGITAKVHNGDVYALSKEDGNYYAMDPEGFDAEDLNDLPYDIAAGLFQGAATAGAGIASGAFTGGAGTIPTAMATSGLVGGGLEALRQKLGQWSGIPQDVSGTDAAIAGAIGTVAPALLGTGAQGVKALTEAGRQAQRSLVTRGIGKMGEKIYQSGLKNIDEYVSQYGKEPVSQVLGEHGIYGSVKSIQRQMDDLSDVILAERNRILKDATKQGGEVSMERALAPTRAKIQELRNSRDPNMKQLIEALENEVAKFSELEAKAPQQYLRELPVGPRYVPGQTMKPQTVTEFGEVALPTQADYVGPYRQLQQKGMPTKLPIGQVDPPDTGDAKYYARNWEQLKDIVTGKAPYVEDEHVVMGQLIPEQYVPNKSVAGVTSETRRIPGQVIPEEYIQQPAQTVIDTTERVMGPTPLQATGYKSSLYSNIPDSYYKDSNMMGEVARAAKGQARGMKEAVEETVEQSLGQEKGQMLRKLNDKLGRLLTSKEKVEKEAAKEVTRNLVTPVDALTVVGGSMAGGAPGGAAALMLKKLADLSKTAVARTTLGYGLSRGARNTTEKVVPQVLRGAPAYVSPWFQMMGTDYYGNK